MRTTTLFFAFSLTVIVFCCRLISAEDKAIETYGVRLHVISKLQHRNVPMDPVIDFAGLIQKAGLVGVVDPNSIQVIDLATGQPVSIAITDDFAYSDKGRVEWVIAESTHLDYEIQFRIAPKRSELKPQRYVPAIGVGDLLRYNAGAPRPITLFYSAAMADLTGDGNLDLVGCWNYAYRPGDPWSGVVCYPRLSDSHTVQFGDLIRPRYTKKSSDRELHTLGNDIYLSAALADFNKDGKIDIVQTGANAKSAIFFLNSGQRDHSGLPIFTQSESINASKWNACRAVDLNHDGALDLVIDGQYIENKNPDGWPFLPAKEVDLHAGNQPCFLDVDGDRRLDAVTLTEAEGAGLSSYQVSWQRNIGEDKPMFAKAKLLTSMNSFIQRPRGVCAVREGSDYGILVQHDDYQAISFFKLVDHPQEGKRFEYQFRAESNSAVMSLSDQAWPCLCDWDDDGDLDLLVGGGYGWPRIVINQGTSTRPDFAEPKQILANGKPIRLLRDEILGQPKCWHNMGYVYPVFIDWDNDGLADLICPNETNRIFWYKNKGTRQKPIFGKRRQVLCDGYPDSAELRTLSAKRASSPDSNNGVYPMEKERPFLWRMGVAFADFNGDGLTDFVTHDGHTRKATLFAQYRNNDGLLQLRKNRALKLADGREINDAIVKRRSHWTESFRAVDWDNDGLMDLVYSFAGAHGGIQDDGSIYLLRNCGTKTDPKFENPVTMRCFGEPIRVTNHGPHPWVGDFNADGKPDLLCCVEWSVYPFYSHAALVMKQHPKYTLGQIKKIHKVIEVPATR